MSRLRVSIAVGDYDRIRPLIDGAVQIAAVDPQFLLLPPEEIFPRANTYAEFDIAELSLSNCASRTAQGSSPYVAVPVFLSRAFRHGAIYVRTDRIRTPEDLKGKRVGVLEFQPSANVWVRLMLEQEFGVRPCDIRWVRGTVDPARRPTGPVPKLSEGIAVEDAPEGTTISGLLASGEIDAFIGARPPACVLDRHPHVGRLFTDPQAAALDWYRRRQLFPIMHVLGIRRALVDHHPWLLQAVLKSFTESKTLAIARLQDTSTYKAMVPFLDEQMSQAARIFGDDFWSYGLAKNRHVISAFLTHHHAEGLSARSLTPEDLFQPNAR